MEGKSQAEQEVMEKQWNESKCTEEKHFVMYEVAAEGEQEEEEEEEEEEIVVPGFENFFNTFHSTDEMIAYCEARDEELKKRKENKRKIEQEDSQAVKRRKTNADEEVQEEKKIVKYYKRGRCMCSEDKAALVATLSFSLFICVYVR